MKNNNYIVKPIQCNEIIEKAAQLGFEASCDDSLGNFLRIFTSTKKAAHILELGTGVGYSTAWILDGMDADSTLYSVEMNQECMQVAEEVLGNNMQLQLTLSDGAVFIENHLHDKFDLIFADTWPGKFYLNEEVLNMVKPGGMYIIDDLNPQQNWPEGHIEKVHELIAYLEGRDDFHMIKLDWSSGIIIMTKKHV